MRRLRRITLAINACRSYSRIKWSFVFQFERRNVELVVSSHISAGPRSKQLVSVQ